MSAWGDLLEWFGIKFHARKQIIIKGLSGLTSLVLCWHDTAELKGASACVWKRNQHWFSLPHLWTDMRGSCVKEGWTVAKAASVIQHPPLLWETENPVWKVAHLMWGSKHRVLSCRSASGNHSLSEQQHDTEIVTHLLAFIFEVARKTLSILPTVTFYSVAAEHRFFCFHLNCI